jgi:replication factor C subunit 3/5
MSDVDEMDLDEEPPAHNAVTFSSELKGKKLSKANLPVRVGDTLPWLVVTISRYLTLVDKCLLYYRVEKYRPDTLNDVSGHDDILTTSKPSSPIS